MKLKAKPIVALASVLAAAVMGFGLASNAMANVDRPEYVSNELLVKFHPGVSASRAKRIIQKTGSNILHNYRLTDLKRIQVPAEKLKNIQARLERFTEVAYVEKNYIRYLDTTPNDPDASLLWGLHNVGQTGGTTDADIDAPEAWDISTGSPDITVAIIDSGVDYNHPDLAANMWVNEDEIPGNNIDDDNNGYVDDIYGWDFSGNDNNPMDDVAACGGHGTHTAGTVGAVGDNGVGVVGVNWDVSIMALKAGRPLLGILCTLNDADTLEAVEYAAANGALVSNNSYGGGGYNQAVFDTIRAAKQHLFVAAAGNEGRDNDTRPSYPANYNLDNIVSVAASDHNDLLADFSNYGVTTVDLSAPGVSILSTVPGNNYENMSGTSMASPHVAGAAALMLAADPTLTTNELKWRLMAEGDPVGHPTITGARLNVFQSMIPDPSAVTVTLTPTSPTAVAPGDTITFTVSLDNNTAESQIVSASVVVVLPTGIEIALAEVDTTLPAGQSVSRDFTQVVPSGGGAGDYELIGRAVVTGVSFDEDLANYMIVR